MRSLCEWFVIALVATIPIGCTGEAGPAGPPGPPGPGADGGGAGAVGVQPAAATVAVGATTMLAASPGGTYTWESSDAAVATVADGTVTGVAPGTAFISASNTSGVSGFAVVTVTAGAPPVSFARDILPLFTQNDVWYTGGAACNARGCHTGAGSAHDLEMGTHAGILLGADVGAEPIVIAGDAEASSLRARLRNNRMPWGIPPTVPRNGPPVMSVRTQLGWLDASSLSDTNGIVKLVEAWINAMAPDGSFPYVDSSMTMVTKDFATDVLPLFTMPDVWAAGTEACNAAGCHNGTGGAHDLDMGTYAGIILGADAGAEPIIIRGDAAESPLRKRLRNNRMPWGMPNWVPRNGQHGEVLRVVEWIEGGALND